MEYNFDPLAALPALKETLNWPPPGEILSDELATVYFPSLL